MRCGHPAGSVQDRLSILLRDEFGGRHNGLADGFVGIELMDEPMFGIELAPRKRAVRRETQPYLVDAVRKFLRRVLANQSARTGCSMQRLEYEWHFHGMGCAKFAATGRRMPIELVHVGLTLMRCRKKPSR